MTTWDASFEAAPADSDEYKYGANKIRELKTAISERLELEMNFKAGTQPLLKAGQAAVLYSGNTTAINALANMSTGAAAWDTTLSVFKRYSGNAWVVLQPDHGNLAGLTDDDHTQYIHSNKVNQTLSQNLSVAANITIDGVDISAHAAANAVAAHGNVGVHTHANANQGGTLSVGAQFITTTYVGTGANGREVNIGVDLANAANAAVVVKNTSAARAAAFRTSNDATANSHKFTAVASANDLIQSFTANGFTLGTNRDVNYLADNYIAMIWYQV